MMVNKPRLEQLNEILAQEQLILRKVLELVRGTKRVNCKTLRQQIEANIRDEFLFTDKWCPLCKEWKSKLDFKKDRTRKEGLGCYCHTCDAFRCQLYQLRKEGKIRGSMKSCMKRLQKGVLK